MTIAYAHSIDRAGEPTWWESLARAVMRWSIPLNVIVSVGNFNTKILPEDLAILQQIVSIGAWLMLIGAAGFARPILRLELRADAAVLVLFYGYAILSVLWTDLEPAAALKSVAMVITTVGAYFMVTRLSLDDVIAGATRALFAICIASIACALLAPDIGVDNSYMHEGQWQGVFYSKQSLGMVGAYLMFFACYRQLTGHGWLSFLTVFSVAVLVTIASGSRGGGALALAACSTLYFSRWSVRWTRLFASLPFVIGLIACAVIYYFWSTGYPELRIAGAEINLTERTFIWQYALAHFDKAPFVGHGLNGFWTVDAIYDRYLQAHGWVLDNYHSGYVGIAVETGLTGLLLFMICSFFFLVKMLYLIDNRIISRPHAALIAGYAVMTYQINLTETMFLRSTNFNTVLLVAVFMATFRALDPKPSVMPAMSNLRRRLA